MIENVFEALLVFLMLYITLITFQSRIGNDVKYYVDNFLFFHSVVDINYLCNKSTGDWRKVYMQNITGRYFLKLKKGNAIYYYCNGSLYQNLSNCNLGTCRWLGLPVIAINKTDSEKYHGIIYRCIK